MWTILLLFLSMVAAELCSRAVAGVNPQDTQRLYYMTYNLVPGAVYDDLIMISLDTTQFNFTFAISPCISVGFETCPTAPDCSGGGVSTWNGVDTLQQAYQDEISRTFAFVPCVANTNSTYEIIEFQVDTGRFPCTSEGTRLTSQSSCPYTQATQECGPVYTGPGGGGNSAQNSGAAPTTPVFY